MITLESLREITTWVILAMAMLSILLWSLPRECECAECEVHSHLRRERNRQE